MPAQEHPFAYLRKRADVLKCCGDPKNLFVRRPRPDTLIAHCTVCNRRHRKLACEAGTLLERGFEAMAAKRPQRLILPGDPAFKI